MQRNLLILLATSALGACGHGDDRATDQSSAPPRSYTITLTGIDAVKKGSDDALMLDVAPVNGATVTRD